MSRSPCDPTDKPPRVARSADACVGAWDVGTIACGSPAAKAAGLIAERDWEATPVGPRSSWQQSLETTVRILLASRFPMCAAWGPDLTFFYNDAYAPFLGGRHPGAMGRPFKEVWPELLTDLQPLISQALSGDATWSEDRHLVMSRNGYDEDTWWTSSYSALYDDGGAVVGFLDVCSDTTPKVLRERLLFADRERLRDSEANFRALVKATSDVVYRMSPDWRRMDRLDGRGFLPDTFEPTVDWIETYIPAEDREALRAAIQQAVRTASTFHYEHRVIQVDGSIGWVLSRAVPVLDRTGQVASWFGMAADTTARHEHDEQIRTIVNELDHRVKNNLAMVQAIAAQTFRGEGDPGEAGLRFTARLHALGRANNILTGAGPVSGELGTLLAAALSSHSPGDDRLLMEGPPVSLPRRAALAMGLAIHELATNATKYGAWSSDQGRVLISWDTAAEPVDGFLVEWREEGGPCVTPPVRRGFGSKLIERTLAAELRGSIVMDFEPSGLICRMIGSVERQTDLAGSDG